MNLRSFFCENHEERGRRGRKKDLRKKKAFAFFHIEIILSFFSLFSFLPMGYVDNESSGTGEGGHVTLVTLHTEGENVRFRRPARQSLAESQHLCVSLL
jgi:hypothetical protein